MPETSKDIVLEKLHQLDATKRDNLILKTTVTSTVGRILDGIETPEIKLKVNKIWTKDKYDNDDVQSQLTVRNRNQTWADELHADLDLIDKLTGKPIDHVKDIKIANIPKLTNRSTYIIRGNEYQFTKQSRLKPGVYTRIQNNGEISSFFNVDKTVDFERGFNNNFKINFDPEKKIFVMTYGSKNVPLLNVLNAVGVDQQKMKDMWGEDVYESNRKAFEKKDVPNQRKMYEAIFGYQPAKELSNDQIAAEIKARLFATELDPRTTKITLGKPYTKVDEDSLLSASKKIIDVHRGAVEPDDRDAIVFKSFHDADDHIKENLIRKVKNISFSIQSKLNKTKSINRSISTQTFDPYTVGTLVTSQLSNPPGQTNVLSIIGENSKMTILGEGGIGSANQISDEARQISNSQAGFLDPLHTPEGPGIGVAVHHTMGAVKIGKDLYSSFLTPEGDRKFLTPAETYDKTIAFPDEYNMTSGKPVPKDDIIRAIKGGKITTVKPGEVDYIIKSHSSMFDVSSNLIPFLDSLQGNRGLTASKMKEQALPLKYRDKPLWHIVDEKNRNLNKVVGGMIAIPKSPVDGTVAKLTENTIDILDKKGKRYSLQLYNNFKLNAESFLHNEPLVKVGDEVKAGQILADNNNTRDGELALGANLRVAYVPWKGYNYEDSAIISESAAKKLTSEHLYGFSTKRSSSGLYSRDKFRAYYPEETDSKKSAKLDKDGIIKPGEKVESGDILISLLEKREPTADDLAVGRLDKQLKKDYANQAVKWENDHVGVVTGVEKHGNTVTVNVKTEEPLKVADKIAGLHGNKHIVSKIVPDEEMPHTEDGKVIDLTMNPIGVSNRINTSQLLEAAAGKLAEKTGVPYVIQNFTDHDNTTALLDELHKNGLTDKEILVDPETGKALKNPVMTGMAHIMKLEHKIDHKFSARYREGYDSNEQPLSGGETGGKNLGRMEIGALLARGAKENLREMFDIKGQRNDDYWHALEMGHMLPPPKAPFVWSKMVAMMKGAGINVEQEGKTFKLRPLTDKHILELSAGELVDPTLTYRKKDLAPMNGGLFDPIKTGGLMGERYTHFKLPEKVLNPITAKAAATLLGMPETHLESVINGDRFYDPKANKLVEKGTPGAISGGPAIEQMLEKINVNSALKEALEQIKTAKTTTDVDKLNKKIRYLKQLKRDKMEPSDYMIQNVLVVPPKFRPMATMGPDHVVIMSDVNDLYQQAATTASSMRDLKESLKETAKGNKDLESVMMAQARSSMYQDMKALAGLREPTAFLHKIKDKKGFVMQIDGGKKQTKEGFYQDKTVNRRQDLVGRSTIVLNPDLGGDQIGIPKDMATKLFQPFIMRELVGLGYPPLEAQKHIKDETEIFKKARQIIADKRLLIANRAPTVHRWNMLAFRPTLTDGKAIEMPAVVISRNLGGDFDGDSIFVKVFVSIETKNLKYIFKSIKKIRCGCIDFKTVESYLSFINERKVSMPSQTNLPIRRGEIIIHIDLEDFPRIESTKRTSEKGVIVYDVPEGVSIYTTDAKGINPILMPVTKFSIHPGLSGYIVEMRNGDEIIVSTDHSLVAMNTMTGELEEVTPKQASRRAIPKVVKIDPEITITKLSLLNFSKGSRAINTKSEIDLDFDTGYVIGAVDGDGWVPEIRKDSICLANIDDDVGLEFCRIIDSMLDSPCANIIQDNYHDFEGHICYSKKWTKRSTALAENFGNWVGYGSHNKHLPPFFMSTPESFRLGLLSGLIDTDGTATWGKAKTKPSRQFMFFYSTMSERLALEIVTLSRSLGIRASITVVKPKNEYRITFSAMDIHGKKIVLNNNQKRANLQEFQSQPLTDKQIAFGVAANDFVPFSKELFKIAQSFIKFGDAGSSAMYNGKNTGIITRFAAKNIIKQASNLFPKWWIDVINNESVTWTIIKELKPLNKKVTMYDLTVPGPYTFMTDTGIIVQDTLQIHVPIGVKAQEEAEHMLPSSDMLKTGYDTVLNTPAAEAIAGSWLVSKGKGGTDKGKFPSLDEARKAHANHVIDHSDVVEIDGIKAPYGMHEINSVVPEDLRDYKKILDKKAVENWIKEVTKKHSGHLGLALADKIKEIGNEYSTAYGFTIGLSDTVPAKEIRDPILKEALRKKSKDDVELVGKLSTAIQDIETGLKKKYDENTMLGLSFHSGAGRDMNNTAQIISAPVLLQDANDRPIPNAITHGYAEGLRTGDYWAAAHGARAGNIKKSIMSYKPGWMTNDLINSLYSTRIYNEQPTDTVGLEVDISDTKNIMNRYLAQEVKDSKGRIIAKRNELIDSDAINRLSQSGIKTIHVQSPLTDPTSGDGISSWSYGVDYKGNRYKTGDNIGIISAHTITEPSLNLSMKAFHTGGAFKKTVSAFDMVDRLLRMNQNIPGKATLASVSGKVKDIEKSSIGGYDITVNDQDGDHVHYVETGNDLKVGRGDRIEKGQTLSSGDVSPHDILKYRGMKNTQRFLVDEISKINDHNLDRRDIEVLVRGLTNTTRIKKSNSGPYIPGDIAQTTTVEEFNRNRQKEVDVEDANGSKLDKDYWHLKKGQIVDGIVTKELQRHGIKRIHVEVPEIEHEPFLTAGGIASKASTQEDWIARLSHNRLRAVLTEGASQGWTADSSGAIHPLPNLVVGGTKNN